MPPRVFTHPLSFLLLAIVWLKLHPSSFAFDGIAAVLLVAIYCFLASAAVFERERSRSALACVLLYAWVWAPALKPWRDTSELSRQVMTVALPVLLAITVPRRILAVRAILLAAILVIVFLANFVDAMFRSRSPLPRIAEILILTSPAIGLGMLIFVARRERSELGFVTGVALVLWCALWLLAPRLGWESWISNLLIPAMLAGTTRSWVSGWPASTSSLTGVTHSTTPASPPILFSDASHRDALTNAYNRRALDTDGLKLYRGTLKSDRPVSILMLDIDHFKLVNDLYGHAAGDVVLKQFTEIVANQVRGTDFVARYGGEEFCIILSGAPLAPAMRLAEKMRESVQEAEMHHGGRKLKITTSIGVTSTFPGDVIDFPQTIARADKNLYRAKRNGRNRVMADPLPGEL